MKQEENPGEEVQNLIHQLAPLAEEITTLQEKLTTLLHKRSTLQVQLQALIRTNDITVTDPAVLNLLANEHHPMLLRQVSELNLSTRSARCLSEDGIIYIGELVQVGEKYLLHIRGLGKESLKEIKRALERIGLTLGMKFNNWQPQPRITT